MKKMTKEMLDSLTTIELREAMEYIQLRRKSAKAAPSVGTHVKNRWMKLYEELTSTSWYWTAKDAQAAKLLAQKVRDKIRRDNLPDSDEQVAEGVELFSRATWKLNNKFYCDNFSLSLLNSQFNSIYRNIKSGKNGKQTISNDYKSRVLDDLNS